VLSSFDDSISRLQRFLDLTLTLTWGVAPGYYISRRWRWFADFCSKAVQSHCHRLLKRSFTKKPDGPPPRRTRPACLKIRSGLSFTLGFSPVSGAEKKLRNRFNGFLVARVSAGT
jgi:hypothetical protein